MKGLKKLVTGILAGALAFTMALGTGNAAQVQAAGERSLTISNARNNQEYNIYRVFDFTPAEDDFAQASDGKIHGVYTLASKFSGLTDYTYSYKDDEGADQSVAMSSFFTIGDNGILDVSGITDDNVSLFGKAVLAYVNSTDPKVAADGTQTANAGENAKADAVTTVTFSNIDYGYYVVDSSLGSAVSVNTTTPNASIQEKNDVPSLDKTITGKSNAAKTYTDLTGNNAQIGDIITFQVTAQLKVGGTNYKIVDEMTDGLTFNKIVSVKNGDDDYGYDLTITYRDDEKTDAKGFEMTFAEPKANANVVVTYTATVNKNAEINPGENVNKAYLEYGKTHTPSSETITKTYPMQIKKVDELNSDKVLPGAHFNVYRKADNSLVSFTKKSDTVYNVDPDGVVTDVVTVDGTPLTINGLDAATYVLVETQAPAGYNLLVAPNNATFTISEGNTTTHFQEVTVSTESTATAPTVATVVNKSGVTLPSTGGIGTTIFYIIGGLLIVVGIAYFILRRKTNAD